MINDKGDTTKEINKRISECHLTWKRLDIYWKHADATEREKLIVYDSIIRSKLMYGLESVNLTETLKK